jgi:hypothetical protein
VGGKNISKNSKLKAGIITAVIVCMMGIPTFAAANVVVSLSANQVWTSGYAQSRSGNYTSGYASCSSVYPLSGSDNFKKMQFRLTSSSGTQISLNASYVLEEGGGYSGAGIKSEYAGLQTIYFQFRGNSHEAANAVVNYFY